MEFTMEIPDWLAIVLSLLLALYIYGTWTHGFFLKKKIPFPKPTPILGNFGPVLLRKTAITDFTKDLYDEFEGNKMYGFFFFNSPAIVLRDPELIKLITVKDFDYFTDHNMMVPEDDLFGKNLFALKGERWKNMRHTLSPAFTSSKMKNMFLLIAKCGEQMADYLEKKCRATVDGIVSLELKEFYTKYTNDVIATSAFGIHVDSLENPDNEFYAMGKEATDTNTLRIFLFTLAPKLMQILGIDIFPKKVTNFFRTLVHNTIAIRENENIVRPDMIHLLMQAKKEAKGVALTDDDITAQAFLFFFAGFDTSSTLLCFMTHLIATHPDVQERVREEIDSVLADNGGEVTYAAIQQLKYLDTVMSETLRLWPPAIASDRVCVRPYTIKATDTSPEVKVNVGDMISIPSYALQRDPKYFPDPERFDPDRFSDENKGNINPFTYLPFGAGPRICIGMRFAQMEAKIAILSIISRFNVKVIDKTPNPIRIDKKALNLTPEGGFWLGFELRNAESDAMM